MINTTIPYLLKRAAFKHPDKEAIVSEEGRWTYAQWEANANKRAQALARHGVKKGDHVATIFFNGNEVLETYLALMKLGAVIVPLNVRLAPGELQYIIEHSEASSLILSHEFESPIREIKGDLRDVGQYFMSGGDVQEDMIPFEEIYQGEPEKDPSVDIDEDDIACILYTAGTTGRPKGVLLSHGNCVWGGVNIALNVDLKPEYRVLLVFPLYHAAAFIILVGNVFLGCTNVTMRTFDPKRVMELIGEEKIGRMTFPPTVWNFILQLPDLKKYDTSSVRSISSGAESMPLDTKKKLLDLFPNAALGETYGMTESAATITTLDPKDVLRKMASVGKPFANIEIRLVDDEGNDVASGEVGEILARGPSIMEGYYKEPEVSAGTLKDGWLHTGDLGRVDEEGFLYIVDRKKDMIITGGENIFPREIEEVLYAHPKILEAAVIGLPDPDWGERVHAVVALKEGETLTEQEVIDYCKRHIASFKKPKSVGFVEKLPRSPAGKVLKRILREKGSASALM
ncbi:MAG: long-chain-fatty-acid--CoA ligase [Desulfobacteraceae bacterium]|nr:long-chain-fatty-acid--CoA ligase [Desulfobacteraceae bacterium]